MFQDNSKSFYEKRNGVISLILHVRLAIQMIIFYAQKYYVDD